MKTWKDVPYFFTNGKFQFIDNWLERETLTGSMQYKGGTWLLNENGEEVSDANDCTLIARKIEDMTDEEWLKVKFPKRVLGDKTMRLKWFKFQVLTADDLDYLLSIGVYPFDQSHFETGDVIDIKTLEEKQ